jgi:hypothetical protein
VECRLVEFPLKDHPPYEALSYEWKKHEGTTTVLCNSSAIQVTRNLASALRAFRHKSEERVLWIDAICINQDDAKERGSQVSMMRDIYSGAMSVRAWLGPSSEWTSEVFRVLKLFAFIWMERLPLGMNPENPGSFTYWQRPKGSVFLSTEDISCFSFAHGYHGKTITLSRPPGLDDDALLQFSNKELWETIDNLFTDTYFERTWIQQEITVHNAVYVACGKHELPFDVFSAAFSGRLLMSFVDKMPPNSDSFMEPLIAVQIARKCYRDPNFESDLAWVLANFNYTKETVAHDHIYAPMLLVKSQSKYGKIEVDYTKPIDNVFPEAATCIILGRRDLLLWGSKTLYTNRKIKDLPSWVPEWTGPNCEEAIECFGYIPDENYIHRLVEGNPSIQHHSLFVNAHILDEIDFTAFVNTPQQIWHLVTQLHQRGFRSFDRYHNNRLEDRTNYRTDNSGSGSIWQTDMIDTFWILCNFSTVSEDLLFTLSQLFTHERYPLDYSELNLEALWSTLTPESFLRVMTTHKPPCELLFLVTLFIRAFHGTNFESFSPLKNFTIWTMVAEELLRTAMVPLMDLCNQHFSRLMIREGERFFVTKKGWFGRAPVQDDAKKYVIAIPGGAFTPYVLEKKQDHYILFSHAFVEGVMDWQRLPSGASIQRIELR